MAPTSLFYSRLVCHWGVFCNPPGSFPCTWRFAAFAVLIHSRVPSLQTCFGKWCQKSVENVSPKRDSETISCKHSKDVVPMFCNIFFSLLTFLGKTQVHLYEDARLFWEKETHYLFPVYLDCLSRASTKRQMEMLQLLLNGKGHET